MPAGARAVAQAFPGQGWLLGAPSTQHPAPSTGQGWGSADTVCGSRRGSRPPERLDVTVCQAPTGPQFPHLCSGQGARLDQPGPPTLAGCHGTHVTWNRETGQGGPSHPAHRPTGSRKEGKDRDLGVQGLAPKAQ